MEVTHHIGMNHFPLFSLLTPSYNFDSQLNKKYAAMQDSPVVNVACGSLTGVALQKPTCVCKNDVFGYLGIPFATPPLGKLRFEPPQRTSPWKGTLRVDKLPPNPLQNPSNLLAVAEYSPFYAAAKREIPNVNEDCLYLNVYTPKPQKEAKLPVIFSIPGGAFKMGGSVLPSGDVLCGLHDVVLVVANYRVGLLGFLSMGSDTDWTGNVGFLDQVAALQWVKENIAAFGGDPNNVTIHGESAGGNSVSLHMLSPLSRGLFHRAMAQSGGAVIPSVFEKDRSEMRAKLFKTLNITETEPKKIMEALKKIPAMEILEAQNALFSDDLWLSVDGKFLPEHPRTLMKKQNMARVPLVLGFNNTEGSGILSLGYPPQFAEGLDETMGTMIISGMLAAILPPEKIPEALKLITSEYWKVFPQDDRYKWSKLVGNMVGDGFLATPMLEQAFAHTAAGNTTYVSFMEYRLKANHSDDPNSTLKRKPEFCEADHADDLIFAFGVPFSAQCPSVGFNTQDKALSMNWMQYIVNFATNGNPNEGTACEVQWPQFQIEQKQYLSMKDPPKPGCNILGSLLKLWMQDLPALIASNHT